MNRLKRGITLGILAVVMVYGKWEEVGKVVGDPASAVSFGYSIDIDGKYAAVGDPDENAVYVFKADANGTWQPFDKIVSPMVAISLIDEFHFFEIGTDLAIDDQSDVHGDDVVLAIGSPKVDEYVMGENLPHSGILIYRLNNTGDGFDRNTTFLTDDYNTSGRAVALDSYAKNTVEGLKLIWHVTEILAIGKPASGVVDLHYYSDQADWNQTTITPSAGDGKRYGESVALSIRGDQWYLAVGAPEEDVTKGSDTYQGKGAVYLYQLAEGTDPWIVADNEYRIHQWIPDIFKPNTGVVENSAFGTSVDLENNGTTYDTVRLIVGAQKENIGYSDFHGNYVAHGGEACVYEMTTPPPSWEWSRISYPLKGSTVSSVDDGFGLHVAAFGNLAVVSAPMLDGGKGAVFAYDFNGTSWVQRPVLQPANAEGFGSDVAIVHKAVVSGNTGKQEVSAFEYQPDQPMDVNPSILIYLLD